jgi:hypothetical protein
MSMNATHAAIIDLWDSDQQLADEIGSKLETVRKWRQRRIPSDWWPKFVDVTADREWALSLAMFHGLDALPRRAPRAKRAA